MSKAEHVNYVADCLHNLAPDSGASVEYCRALVTGLLSGLLSCGLTHSQAYRVIADKLPDDYRVDGIPVAFRTMIQHLRPEPTTNEEQELYVLPAGSGYSCLGFDVLIARNNGACEWLRDNGYGAREITPDLRGTMEAYRIYQETMSIGQRCNHETGKRCPAELTPQLRGLEGRRVEVVDKYGDKRRFWVGKSTGWLPVHLEIKRRDSSGGCAVTGAPFQSVRSVG
ncbi:MAG: hypothetical protein DWQ31_17125 [Planctomycetota bacterium]|nr:MAG: hypothetical protein DWQ31_17125 [Planctomycetota bacterium]REJ92077.1 MAG: hypothetical protein DWQ35_13075 [Planctomycetota bacterium]REK28613.1 MAG: hypothetical protein DWQ42_04665 [Planctomycetota bacterium]REK39227.1 MAG: hypothetical protein DWQ46_18245 [Planctomycetota bacterium]